MTLHRADGTTTPMKYLAYWEKQPTGWRVLAYKRGVVESRCAGDARVVRAAEANGDRQPPTRRRSNGIARASPKPSARSRAMRRRWVSGRRSSTTAIRRRSILVDRMWPRIPGRQRTNWRRGWWRRATEHQPRKLGTRENHRRGKRRLRRQRSATSCRTSRGADGKIPPGQPFFTIWKRDSPKERWLYIAE